VASRPAYLYITACRSQHDAQRGGQRQDFAGGDRLPGPPGWSGAKPVMSHTCPSTTIQQSVLELCLEISEADNSFD
jgi:hypothetical protein